MLLVFEVHDVFNIVFEQKLLQRYVLKAVSYKVKSFNVSFIKLCIQRGSKDLSRFYYMLPSIYSLGSFFCVQNTHFFYFHGFFVV